MVREDVFKFVWVSSSHLRYCHHLHLNGTSILAAKFDLFLMQATSCFVKFVRFRVSLYLNLPTSYLGSSSG